MLIYLDLCLYTDINISLLIEWVTYCMLGYIRLDWVRFWLIQYTILGWTMGKFRAQGVHQTGQHLLASANLIVHLPIEFPNNICWCAWLTFGYWVYVYSRKLGKGKRQLLWILNRRGAFLPFFHLVLPRLVFSSEIATAQAAGCPGLCCKSANNKISEKKVWGWHFRGRSNLELVRFWRFYNLFL